MPKVKLEFELPEEQNEYDIIMKAGKYHNVIWDIQNYLRNEWKYNDEKYSDEEYKLLETIRDRLWEILSDHDVLGDF